MCTLSLTYTCAYHSLAQLETTIPLLRDAMAAYKHPIDAVAFPDEGTVILVGSCLYPPLIAPPYSCYIGAAKRFGGMFSGVPVVICGKVRQGDKRIVTVQVSRHIDCQPLEY